MCNFQHKAPGAKGQLNAGFQGLGNYMRETVACEGEGEEGKEGGSLRKKHNLAQGNQENIKITAQTTFFIRPVLLPEYAKFCLTET